MDQTSHSPNPDPQVLEALLNDVQRDFAEVLTLMEQSLRADPEVQAAEASAFQHRIAELQRRTEAGMRNLRGMIQPWPASREQLPGDLAQRIDRFLELLAAGLQGIGRQVDYRVADLKKRRAEISATLQDLNRQRKGVQGYRQKQDPSRIVREEA